MNMTTSFNSFSLPQQMNETTANSTRPMSPLQIKTTYVDGRNPGKATAADQQAAAAAAPLKCPRCDSANTKFCYYNNYSLSQPRHFCKACKRYWTRGGTLRNVPVGGGCRKIKQRIRQPSTKALSSGHRGSNNSQDNVPAGRSHSGMEEPNLGLNDFLYGKNRANMEPFNGFGSTRVTDKDPGARGNYNQIHNSGLGFSLSDYMKNQSSHLSSYSTPFGSNFSSPSGISTASPLMRPVLDGSGFELNQMGSLSSMSLDPSLYNWNNEASFIMNAWPEVPNIGSSIMSSLL
ncbi:unnamed protein product [Rhodiola kirilowii]